MINQLEFESASIFVENGTLIIDADKLLYKNYYRFVMCRIQNGILKITAKKANFQYFSNGSLGDYLTIDYTMFDKVDTEYLITTNKTTGWWLTKKTISQTEIKEGWVELLDTNHIKEFTTSKFIIKHSKPK